MTAPLFIENPHYREYQSRLLKLHEMYVAGAQAHDEAEELREAMEFHAQYLSEEERVRLSQLSASLYMIQVRETFEPAQLDQAVLRARVLSAFEERDWKEVLGLLRRCHGAFRRDHVAFMRAQAYASFREYGPAALFMDYAAQLRPDLDAYKAIALEYVFESGAHDQAESRARELLEQDNVAPRPRIQAASVLHRLWMIRPESLATPPFETTVRVLPSVLRDEENTADPSGALLISGYAVLGFAYEELDRHAESREAFRSALRVRHAGLGLTRGQQELIEYLDLKDRTHGQGAQKQRQDLIRRFVPAADMSVPVAA